MLEESTDIDFDDHLMDQTEEQKLRAAEQSDDSYFICKDEEPPQYNELNCEQKSFVAEQ